LSYTSGGLLGLGTGREKRRYVSGERQDCTGAPSFVLARRTNSRMVTFKGDERRDLIALTV
jgi:hypothetical protein